MCPLKHGPAITMKQSPRVLLSEDGGEQDTINCGGYKIISGIWEDFLVKEFGVEGSKSLLSTSILLLTVAYQCIVSGVPHETHGEVAAADVKQLPFRGGKDFEDLAAGMRAYAATEYANDIHQSDLVNVAVQRMPR